MSEQEVIAQQIAGDNYGLSLEDGPSRQAASGRLFPDERKAFDAGWEAAKQYYLNQPNAPQLKDATLQNTSR